VLDPNDPNIPASIKLAEKIFLKAMRDLYAKQDVEKKPIVGMWGSQSVQWEHGMWKVVDAYFTAPGSYKSTGFTLIVYNEHPIWAMHYGGYYPKAVIPFLKQCLAEAYERNEFNGGRGPWSKYGSEEQLMYTNNIKYGSTFTNFSGDEWIRSRNGNRIVGQQWYRGHSLI
jgi:hypothetical protein